MGRNLDYGRYYGRYHHDSPEHQRWQVDFNRRLLAGRLPPLRNTPALDVGCGMGFAMLYLGEEGFDPVEGIDVDPGQVQSCLDKGLAAYLVEDSVHFVDQRAEQYGLILAMDVLEHLVQADQLALTRVLHKALLPGGHFICSVPNANSSVAMRQRYNDFTHYSSFTEESLDFLLYHAGFRQIEIDGYEFYQPPHQKELAPKNFARLRHFLSYLVREYARWGLRGLVRGWRRLELWAEFGFDVGGRMPLSLNLIAVACKEKV
jgi:SAM-dependent methyltransferase